MRGVVDVRCVVEEAEGDISCSACYVEHFPARRGTAGGGAGVEAADEVVSVECISIMLRER